MSPGAVGARQPTRRGRSLWTPGEMSFAAFCLALSSSTWGALQVPVSQAPVAPGTPSCPLGPGGQMADLDPPGVIL